MPYALVLKEAAAVGRVAAVYEPCGDAALLQGLPAVDPLTGCHRKVLALLPGEQRAPFNDDDVIQTWLICEIPA